MDLYRNVDCGVREKGRLTYDRDLVLPIITQLVTSVVDATMSTFCARESVFDFMILLLCRVLAFGCVDKFLAAGLSAMINHPDLVDDFFELCRICRSSLVSLFYQDNLDTTKLPTAGSSIAFRVTNAAVLCLELQHRDASKTVLLVPTDTPVCFIL